MLHDLGCDCYTADGARGASGSAGRVEPTFSIRTARSRTRLRAACLRTTGSRMEAIMKKSLPSRPNLDYLRSTAKTLLSDLRAGNPEAVKTFIAYLPAAKSMKPAAVRTAGFRLADAQSAIARKAGFASWPGLARHVEQLRGLEGQWSFISLEIEGAPMPAPPFPAAQILIDGDRFRMESPDGTYEGVFNIDVEQDPPHIDIEFVEGPESGEWSYGIYTLERDELVLCLGLTGSGRPQRFMTRSGSGAALERLHRVSSARPAGITGGKRTTPGAAHIAAPAAADESAFELNMTPLLKTLQGDWLPVSLITSGTPLQSTFLAYGSRHQTGNETKVVFGGQTMVHALMRLDESVLPIAVDYLNIGKGPRTISLGILEWDGANMRVCMAKPGEPRPPEFSCDKASGRTLSTWRRK
jgi:uncharacterized protein (TIGR03067 family)